MNAHTGQWLGYDTRRLTLGEVLADKAALIGDHVFLRDLDSGRSYTYREAHEISNRLAQGLSTLGIGPGSHVAVMMGTRPEHLWVQFALGKLGAVAALINTAARGDLLRHYLTLAEVTHVIADDVHVERVLEACAAVPAVTRLVICPTREGTISNSSPEGLVSTTLLAALMDVQEPLPPFDVRFSDPALILFTSGTTGPSKGVVYTHARSLMYALDTVTSFGIRSSDSLYCWMPLFHLSGLQSAVLAALMAEASVAMTSRFSPSGFMDQVRACGATMLMLPGASLNLLWAQAPSQQDREHRVRICLTVPIPSFAPAFEQRFGFRLACAYGLTDCGMPTAFSLSDPQIKMGSAGRPRDGWLVKVVDDDDFDLPVGQPGQIVIRCERPWGTASGYYRNPQATVEAWRNGWFHTGDRGYLDADGYLWYVGRSKDAIRRRGENISAYEVEQVLVTHPAVAEAAAFAVKAELGEEEVAVAVILRSEASLDEAELIEHCAGRMPHYMVPRYVRFVADLPRTLSLKVQKFKLQEEAADRPDALWDRDKAGIVVRRG